MAHRLLLVLLFTLYSQSISHSDSNTYCIVSSTETTNFCTNAKCNNSNTITLSGVQQAIQKHQDLELYLCSYYFTIGSQYFVNLTSIYIRSEATTSCLDCNGKHYGFFFDNVSNVVVENVIFDHCGFKNAIEEFNIDFDSSIYIRNSWNISLLNVTIRSSSGIGMALVDSRGYIHISNCSFDDNHDPAYQKPGGGIFIESSMSEGTTYNIENCSFTSNGGSRDSEDENHYQCLNRTDFMRGGGIIVYFRAETNNINLTITNCLFKNNTALHGGALYVSFQHSAHNVTVLVDQTDFDGNTAACNGGAVAAGYIHETEKMALNKVNFILCKFLTNSARNGGGVYIYAAPKNETENSDTFEFHNCTWKLNNGMYGAALLIAPFTEKQFFNKGFLPIPLIKDCRFISNNHTVNSELYPKVQYGRGTVYVNSFTIEFHSEVELSENFNSALYLYSSILNVKSKSSILFKNNFGYQGGAIHLRGSSSIHVNDDISITFDSNVAGNKGGAIFHNALIDQSLLTATNCFMKYVGIKQPHYRNITVYFTNNTATPHRADTMHRALEGKSIYLFSAIPCAEIYPGREHLIEALNSIANFTFEGGVQNSTIGTYPSDILVESLPDSMIPGKKEDLNITAVDDTNHPVPLPVYIVGIQHGNITIDPAYTTITNNKIKLRGSPGSSGKITIHSLEREDLAVVFHVSLQECPPGFVYSDETSRCECSSDTTDSVYLGIKRCNLTAHQAILVHGFWAGYIAVEGTEETFRTSHCPRGYCTNNLGKREIILPPGTSVEEINSVICHENRTGVICGECKENTSVYCHAPGTLDCRSDEDCYLGPLWLLLSEILPVTILFLVIILCDIQLTTGALNGFLLYMQIFSTLHITANDFIMFPKFTKKLLNILEFVAFMFKLEFFKSKSLSFCLFKKINSLDLLAIDYLIVMYYLSLVLLTILVLNMRCRKISRFCQRFKKQHSVIHGLSGFLVLCYARTTLATLLILNPTRLYGKGRDGGERVAFYHGGMHFFGPQHRKYAIPALFALVFMTFLPPLLLLVYPLCYKVLALLRLEESKLTKLLCLAIPLEKLKPLFDSFQGEFKDDHRHFAGLYFLYRLLALVIFAFANTLSEFYFFLELLLVLMLALHGWFQPYKKKWPNRLDTYIFTLLLIITRMTQYCHQQSLDLYRYGQFIAVLTTIQVVLAYTPFVFMILYISSKIRVVSCIKYLHSKIKKGKEQEEDMEYWLTIMDEGRHLSLAQKKEGSYHKLE